MATIKEQLAAIALAKTARKDAIAAKIQAAIDELNSTETQELWAGDDWPQVFNEISQNLNYSLNRIKPQSIPSPSFNVATNAAFNS